jgi:2-polyprenyl-6-methoxyphenol hydroxylase-like FAD-dependent oxidoreductase
MGTRYDAIIVGARCAGSPTAMLLARKGHRVLVVDKATFPSDSVSTHLVHPRGVAALARWGLAERLVATGCPPIHTYQFDFGPLTIAGAPGTMTSPVSYCPRRTVLDKLLVDAAVGAGAEVREGFTVGELVMENGKVAGIKGHARGGTDVVERAEVVIGADGWQSLVARSVAPEAYHQQPPLEAVYYAYWSGLPSAGRVEIYAREASGLATVPTHDGLTLVMALWTHAQFQTNKKDIEGQYWKALDRVPDLAERLRAARRETPFAGATVPNFFRKPYGPGWALVGDAGYLKDPITAQGISDAFVDAELCSTALDESLRGQRSLDDALGSYQRARDERALPMYQFTCDMATLAPPDESMQQLLGAIHGNQKLMDGFAQSYAGTISPAQFFSPDNVGAILSGRAQSSSGAK